MEGIVNRFGDLTPLTCLEQVEKYLKEVCLCELVTLQSNEGIKQPGGLRVK